MPTRDEYEHFAVEFQRLSEQIRDLAHAVKGQRAQDGVGGTFGGLVDVQIDELKDDFSGAGHDFLVAAKECKRRAKICEQYAHELRAYEAKSDQWEEWNRRFDPSDPFSTPPGYRPQRPDPPYRWVEV